MLFSFNLMPQRSALIFVLSPQNKEVQKCRILFIYYLII